MYQGSCDGESGGEVEDGEVEDGEVEDGEVEDREVGRDAVKLPSSRKKALSNILSSTYGVLRLLEVR